MPLLRCLLARTRSNTTTFYLKIKVLYKVLRGKAGLGFLFFLFFFFFFLSLGGEAQTGKFKKIAFFLAYVRKKLYLCTVFQIIRTYAPLMLILLMSLFVVALAMDEYNDSRRIAEDLRIESCVELETEDYEWDESDLSNQPTYTGSLSAMYISLPFREGQGVGSVPFISAKQRLGLIRRYAPRKALAYYNYALT